MEVAKQLMFLNIKFSERLSQKDIMHIVREQYDENVHKALFNLLFHPNKRISDNAAWVFTHFDKGNRFLLSKQNELIDETMNTKSNSKRRMLLSILCKQPFKEKNFRTDFFDFCEQQITSATETIGTKALCVKLAYKQSVSYQELLLELRDLLLDVYTNTTSAAIKASCRNTLKKITASL